MIPVFVPSFIFPSAAVSYTGPGDVVSGATGWWGLRAYTAASIGANAVRLRESGGNTESDFATISGGGLDISAITTFKGANNLFVTKVYDQVGTNHLVQATAGNQPKFILSAIGSLPAMQDNGATTTLVQSLNNLTYTSPFTFSAVYEVLTLADGMIAIGSTAFPQVRVNQSSGANIVTINNVGSGITATATDNVWHALQGVFNTPNSDCNVDGTAATGATSTDATAGKLDVFSFSGGSNYMRGYITEVGFWSGTAFSGTDSSNMSSNQHSYWGF